MGGRVRPKTLDGYRGLIRLYAMPAIGATALADLGARHRCATCSR